MTHDNSMAELLAGKMPERYWRNQGTIGVAGQLQLLQAKVAVVGAGGLGGHVIELLARQGIGFLTVIDGDCFVSHNLNRQVLATGKTLGQNKVAVAADRVAEINPAVSVTVHSSRLTEANAAEFLAGMDVIVDALDNFSSRRLLYQRAQELRIPLIHAAIAGFTGQVTTILPGDFAAATLFEQTESLEQGVEVSLGNPAATPAFAAAMQVQEAIKLITGIGQPLQGKILYFDLEYNLFELIQL